MNMEVLRSNLDPGPSVFSPFCEFHRKTTSKFICSWKPGNCRTQKCRIKIVHCLEQKNSSAKSKNSCVLGLNEDLVRRVGRGVLGFAAAVSLCSDSPSFAESLTVAFPVSHTREVNIVQRTLVEAWGLIRETFIDPTFNHQDWDLQLQQTMVEMYPLRSEEAAYGKIKGMLSTLGDPFTRIVSPKEYQSFRIGSDGNLQGVGLFISSEPMTGHLVVLSCIENSPAARAGIHEGDELVEINGERLDGVASEAAAQKLRGRAGTIVTVKLNSINDMGSACVKEINLPREVIKLSPISSAILSHITPDGHLSKTGYMKLSTFSQTAAAEMEDAVHEMENQGVQSYILDLRNNPSVTQLHDGSALFITVAKYLSPALHDIDQVGIAPDVQCSTDILSSSKDYFNHKKSAKSLESDSCVLLAQHQLDDIQLSKGSAS